MGIFHKKTEKVADPVEEIFLTMADLTRNLSKKELNRLIEGLTLVWEGWQKVRQTRSSEEREMDELINIEKELEQTK